MPITSTAQNGRKRRFVMKLASVKKGVRYESLQFGHVIDCEPEACGLADPVIAPIVGDKVEYGPLFAYLFRRFGYPNCGWDNYKELARYLLTTPRPDLLLEVVPYAGGTSCIAFRFLVPPETNCAINTYDKRAVNAWRERAGLWRERQGLPDWMPEWVQQVNAFWMDVGATDWQLALNYAGPAGDLLEQRAWKFRQELYEGYKAIEPKPPRIRRGADWSQWSDEDPLKPLAEAAQTALRDLNRPVRVRDLTINAYGLAESGRALREPAVAGYPSGALGNADPSGFAELHALVMTLGGGNAKRGIRKAMAALKG